MLKTLKSWLKSTNGYPQTRKLLGASTTIVDPGTEYRVRTTGCGMYN